MNQTNLQVGQQYTFKIKDFVTPFDDVVKTEDKTRIFLKKVKRGGIDFIKVKHVDKDKTHLIAVETIEGFL